MYKTSIPYCGWPAVPTQGASALLAQLFLLEQSQWLSPEALLQNQLIQLATLINYIGNESFFYRDRLKFLENTKLTLEQFRKIPILTRQELAEKFSVINCKNVPKSHLPIQVLQTSGSTGQIVTVNRTALTNLFWMALTLREHFWHQRDFTKKLACIRANIIEDAETVQEDWGLPLALIFKTGPMFKQSLSLSTLLQAKWLLEHNPDYLITYPTNLNALFDVFESLKQFPNSLKEIRSIGETLTSDLKFRCKKIGVKVTDLYSAQEVGIIASQCPVSGLYHAQSESLLVEVLDDDGNQCQEGQVGRVIITDLHNFATPLLRYEIRDYARVGGTCPCGRGLPTLSEILGRRRNMVSLPDGTKHWPSVGFLKFREIAPIQQYQLIQHSLQKVEVRLVVKEKLSAIQESNLMNVVQDALGYSFTLEFSYSEAELPKTRGGKFEEFISNL